MINVAASEVKRWERRGFVVVGEVYLDEKPVIVIMQHKNEGQQ